MKYIQCARNTTEQNMVVFQYGAHIYFQICKDIQVGEELLVWYAEYYDQYLGIPIGVKKFPNAMDNSKKGGEIFLYYIQVLGIVSKF